MAAKTLDKNDLDNVYEDSIFSITEDAQYPLFNAAQAKEGLYKSKSTQNKDSKAPENNCDTKSKFTTNANNLGANNVPSAPNIFADNIKIDEPLNLGKQEQIPVLGKNPENPVIKQNRPTSLGLSGLNIQNSGRKIGAQRAPFRPRSFRATPKKEDVKKEECNLSPRSKLMPKLARKMNQEHNLDGRLNLQ